MDIIDIPAQTHPWSTVFETAGHFKSDEWVLTGGIMVQAHAMIHGLLTRPTSDADFLLNILTYERIASQMNTFLGILGYALEKDSMSGYAIRFETRSGHRVDMMVADYLYGKRKRETQL